MLDGQHTGVLMGLLIAVAGILLWRFPRLASGYFNLSSEKKEQTDWVRVSRHFLAGYLLLGVLLAASDCIGFGEETGLLVRTFLLFGGILLVMGTARRYDKN